MAVSLHDDGNNNITQPHHLARFWVSRSGHSTAANDSDAGVQSGTSGASRATPANAAHIPKWFRHSPGLERPPCFVFQRTHGLVSSFQLLALSFVFVVFHLTLHFTAKSLIHKEPQSSG